MGTYVLTSHRHGHSSLTETHYTVYT